MNQVLKSLAILAFITGSAVAQVILTGTSYTENFNNVGEGLPSGWTANISTTVSTLGDTGSFTSATTNWNAAISGGNQYRNVAGYSTTNQGTGAAEGSQSVNPDRAFGWRASNGDTARGALTLTINNTNHFENFSASVDVFTGNSTGAALGISFEYRIGATGDFTSVASYTTTSLVDGVTTLSANSVTLSSLDNQAETVYFRVRGVSSDTNTTHTLVVDNFTLSYSAVPEPSTAGVIIGSLVLAGVVGLRRKRHASVRS